MGFLFATFMRFLIATLTAAALLASTNAALAEKRVAFVVGNGAYRHVTPLPNPPIDAKAMAATLRKVGFEVIEGSNLSRDQMTAKLLDFGHKTQGSDVAVFYYAGHGIAVDGSNYLLPVDGRHQVRDGRQAWRGHQHRPDP
ncbi:putative caspase-like protein [Bradyrhizobium sp. GM2.4]